MTTPVSKVAAPTFDAASGCWGDGVSYAWVAVGPPKVSGAVHEFSV